MSYHDTARSIDTLSTPEPVKRPDAPSGWVRAQTLAAHQNGASANSISAIARHYTDGDSATYPILRKPAPPNAHKSEYVYRWDPDARWSGEGVRKLKRRLGWTTAELADETGLSEHVIGRTYDRWLGKQHHDTFDALADEYHGVITAWWAVCDRTCGRHVVQHVYHAPDDAEAKFETAGKHCPATLLHGDGDPPEPGTRILDQKVGESVKLVDSSRQLDR